MVEIQFELRKRRERLKLTIIRCVTPFQAESNELHLPNITLPTNTKIKEEGIRNSA